MRYIDADNILYKDLSEGRGVCWVTFMDWIKEMPTADVRENVRGEWIVKKDIINCSICKRCSWSKSYEDLVRSFNFCPNCGAEMRGDNNGKRNDS